MIICYILAGLLILATLELIRELFIGYEWTKEEKEKEKARQEKPFTKFDVYGYSPSELRKITRYVLNNDRRRIWR